MKGRKFAVLGREARESTLSAGYNGGLEGLSVSSTTSGFLAVRCQLVVQQQVH